MINWVNFLHVYQPPYQEPELIQKVVKESYWYLVETLKENRQAKITMNFSGSLLEHLFNLSEEKLIEEFKDLVKRGQIELVGTARYHPILPLLPTAEIERQISLNNQILKQAFDEYYKPEGFYLPEMAYSLKAAKAIKNMGFKYIILDEISFKGDVGLVDFNQKYKIKDAGIFVVFRNRRVSRTFVPQEVLSLTSKSNPPSYIISATDGEMYGHNHSDKSKVFDKSLKHPQIKTITVSEYLESLPNKTKIISPINSSWESTEKELRERVPYALWQDPKNKIHQNLWELRKIAIRVVNKSKEQGTHYDWARHHLDRGLASCAWWWAAGKKLEIFNFVTWNPDAIEKGIKELISSIRSLSNISKETKLEAEKIYHLLIKEIWKKHWDKYNSSQPAEKKLSLEAKRGLSLLNQNFMIKLFENKLDKKYLYKSKIDYIAIKTFKKKINGNFYHIVARYKIHFKNKKLKPVTIFCNANSRESRQGAYLAQNHIYKNGFAKGDLRCSKPLFYHKQLRAMFYMEAYGDNLYQFISDPKTKFSELKKIVSMSGEWIGKLHSLPSDKAKNFNPIQSKVSTITPGQKKFLKIIENKHKDYPKYKQTTENLYKKIEKLEKELNPQEKYIIHGDFHPENIVYNRDKKILHIIDYTDCCIAHYTRDLGSFYQQLGYMSRDHLSKVQIVELQKIFIKAYTKTRGIRFGKVDNNNFNLYKAWTALRNAMYFLTVTLFDRPRADYLFEESKEYLKKIKK